MYVYPERLKREEILAQRPSLRSSLLTCYCRQPFWLLGYRFVPTQTDLSRSFVGVFENTMFLFADHSEYSLMARESLLFVVGGLICVNIAFCFVRHPNLFACLNCRARAFVSWRSKLTLSFVRLIELIIQQRNARDGNRMSLQCVRARTCRWAPKCDLLL